MKEEIFRLIRWMQEGLGIRSILLELIQSIPFLRIIGNKEVAVKTTGETYLPWTLKRVSSASSTTSLSKLITTTTFLFRTELQVNWAPKSKWILLLKEIIPEPLKIWIISKTMTTLLNWNLHQKWRQRVIK